MAWTRARLKRVCFQLIQSRNVSVRVVRKRDCSARLTYSGRLLKIEIDTLQVGLLPAVVHELLHHVLDRKLLPIFSRTEQQSTWELVMDTLETSVVESILASPEETEKWREAIGRKLSA